MRRRIFTDEHERFRAAARAFFERECAPYAQQWEREGSVSREAWRAAGRAGLLGWAVPEEYGGRGVRDYRFNAIAGEEMYGTGAVGIGIGVQNDIMASYLVELATEERKKRWLPDLTSGDMVTSIAVSEPGTGSNVAALRTTARHDGDHYVISGHKTFVSNGLLSDLVLVAARTTPEAGRKGISLFAVETDTPGFSRGGRLDKIGQWSADTADLFFDEVRVPKENLLGEEDQGFAHLMRNRPAEWLNIAVYAVAASRRAFDLTAAYAGEHKAHGQLVGSYQANRHALAEMKTKLDAMQAYLDQCVMAANEGELTAQEAAGLKWWTTETQWEILDRCLQLHGGLGYLNEHEVARLWRDSRAQRLHGGTTEIMKDLVGRSMGF